MEAVDRVGEKSVNALALVEALVEAFALPLFALCPLPLLRFGRKSRPVSLAETRLITAMAPEFKASGLAKLSSSTSN